MQLLIDGELRRLEPIKNFREAFDLPDDFGVATFEPKDFTGLGRIDSAGAELNIVRRAVLEAIPTEMPLHEWLHYLPHLSRLLENKLHEVNPEIGLKNVEIEYAVGGFEDVIQSLLYGMIRASSEGEPAPEFQQIYNDWLNNSVRISSTVHHYTHRGTEWAIQLVNNAYGRVGLIVWTDESTHYVHDVGLGCPAEGFMLALLSEVATRIIVAASAGSSPASTNP